MGDWQESTFPPAWLFVICFIVGHLDGSGSKQFWVRFHVLSSIIVVLDAFRSSYTKQSGTRFFPFKRYCIEECLYGSLL